MKEICRRDLPVTVGQITTTDLLVHSPFRHIAHSPRLLKLMLTGSSRTATDDVCSKVQWTANGLLRTRSLRFAMLGFADSFIVIGRIKFRAISTPGGLLDG
jgi:hypothetical protein